MSKQLIEAYGPGTKDGLYPTKDQWEKLLRFPHTGTLVTTQFAKFRDSFFEKATQDAAAAYSTVTARLAPELGVETLYEGMYGSVLYGSDDEDWDFIGMLRFPNREVFLKFFLHPDYLAVHGARDLMMKKYRMLISYPPFQHPPAWSKR